MDQENWQTQQEQHMSDRPIDINQNGYSKQKKQNEREQKLQNLLLQDESQISNIYDLQQLNYRLFMNKEYERSFKLQQRLMKMKMKMNDRNPEYYHQQHFLKYLALNDVENAQIWYNEAVSISPYYDRYFFDYELADQVPNSFIDSIKYIQNNIECYKECENQLIAECLFAYIIFLSQRPQKALNMLLQLIQRYPTCYLPYFYGSKCHYHKEDYWEGLKFINQAIMTLRSSDIQLNNLKGQILIQIGDLDEARIVYQLFPSNEYYISQLELIKMKILMQTIKQELKNQNIVIKQPGKLEYKYQEAGINYYKQRKYESRESLHCAIEQNPMNGLCQFILAKCYLKLGDFDNAQYHSNIAASYYDDAQRLVKLLNKIENEKDRAEIKSYRGYQSRMFQ